MADRDYYQILGVSSDSEQEVIDAAYRALIKKHHPDTDRFNTQKLKRAREINEAYEVLGDLRKRAEYDRASDQTSNLPAVRRREQDGSMESPPLHATTGLKRCIDCAEEIQPSARVCRYCGARQDSSNGRDGQTTNVHTHVYTSPSSPAAPAPLMIERPPKKSGCGWLIGAAAVLLLLLWASVSLNLLNFTVNSDAENLTQINSENSAVEADDNIPENDVSAPESDVSIPEPQQENLPNADESQEQYDPSATDQFENNVEAM